MRLRPWIVCAVCFGAASSAEPNPFLSTYAFPDVGHIPGTSLDGSWASLDLGAEAILDHTFFAQDTANVAQVGVQPNAWEIRSARLNAGGELKLAQPWRYYVSLGFNGFDREPGTAPFSFTDLYLDVPLGSVAHLTIGKQKEPFIYEMAESTATLPALERWLNPFFVTRNIGVTLGGNPFNKRTTWAIGAFNDWFAKSHSFRENGSQFAGRVTGLAFIDPSGSRYLHLGLGARYIQPTEGSVRFRGFPESDVTVPFVDTGKLAATGTGFGSGEALLNLGRFVFIGEYARSWVDAEKLGNPSLWGTYVTASWFLTGEHYEYDRESGCAHKLVPESPWGALQLAARYGVLDLDDAGAHGGVQNRVSGLLSWWPTAHWRISIDYGQTVLWRSGLAGREQSVLTRLQWVYAGADTK